MVTGQDVAAFLGKSDDTTLVALAQEHVTIVTAMARSYTRGKGFDEFGFAEDDIAAVITTATARLVGNPHQHESDTAGPFTTRYRVFDGWTLAELFVLNSYRKRAA